MDCIAVGDESSGPYPDGGWLYAMAFPIVRVDRADEVRAGLRHAVAGLAGVLHYYDLTAKRRLEVVRAVADLPWEAALVVCQMTSNHRQERARSRILTNALPRLERIEKVTGLVLESRARSDRHDRRTRARLLGSRMITPSFQVRHVDKHEDELAWLADLVVGAFTAAERRGITEPWDLLEEVRPIEVTWLPHDRP